MVWERKADVTYMFDAASFPAPLHTPSSLVQLNSKYSRVPPVIILDYKGHGLDEKSLWGCSEVRSVFISRRLGIAIREGRPEF